MERSTFRETIGGPLKLFVAVTFGLNEHNRFHISSILDGISILFIFCIWSFLFFVDISAAVIFLCIHWNDASIYTSNFPVLLTPLHMAVTIVSVILLEKIMQDRLIIAEHRKMFTKWLTSRLDFVYVMTGIVSFTVLFIFETENIDSPAIKQLAKVTLSLAFSMRFAKAFLDIRDNKTPFIDPVYKNL